MTLKFQPCLQCIQSATGENLTEVAQIADRWKGYCEDLYHDEEGKNWSSWILRSRAFTTLFRGYSCHPSDSKSQRHRPWWGPSRIVQSRRRDSTGQNVWRSGKLTSGQRNGRSPRSSHFARKVITKTLDGFQSGLQIVGRIVTNLCYADDITLLATSKGELQELVDRLDRVSHKYSLLINVDKTKVNGERRHSVPHTHSQWAPWADGYVPIPWVPDCSLRWWEYDENGEQAIGVSLLNVWKSYSIQISTTRNR